MTITAMPVMSYQGMNSMERVPLQIKDQYGMYNYRDSYKKILSYSVKQDDNYVGFALRPYDIENKFEIVNRPEPKSKIITQSKYDCAAASLAMLINKPLYYVKQALARHGWRNDSYGCSTEMMILAARDFGIDLFPVGPKQIKPGDILTNGKLYWKVNSVKFDGCTVASPVTKTGKPSRSSFEIWSSGIEQVAIIPNLRKVR